jgi:YebC/PmpR family DNA-binding regulatory protein
MANSQGPETSISTRYPLDLDRRLGAILWLRVPVDRGGGVAITANPTANRSPHATQTMSGHNKWSKIKHKKQKRDRRRAKLFNKLIREITVAAREGGGDPEYNPRLRVAIDRAHDADMPKDNIEKAIKRGTGELEGVDYEEETYEGYGPAGVAVFVRALTDNNNRTVAELRHLFDTYEGDLGEDGCVAWQFERRGEIKVPQSSVDDEDDFLLETIEYGAIEMEESTFTPDSEKKDPEDIGVYAIYTDFTDLHDVDEALREADYEVKETRPVWSPTQTVELDRDDAETFLEFYHELEDHDDVQSAFANCVLPDDMQSALD